jgi:hypothetical protein
MIGDVGANRRGLYRRDEVEADVLTKRSGPATGKSVTGVGLRGRDPSDSLSSFAVAYSGFLLVGNLT